MKTHNQINELLAGFALGELGAEQTNDVEKHLSECKICRIELEKIEAILKAADEMKTEVADQQLCESAKNTLLASIKETKPSSNIKKSLWRIIIRSPIMKLAAAVFIIAAGLILITTLEKSVSPLYALEQSFEKSKNEPWMHNISNAIRPGDKNSESWISFTYGILASRDEKKEAQLIEFRINQTYIYEPNSDTITISAMERGDIYDANSVFELLDIITKTLSENEGAKITTRNDVINGENFEVIEISVPRGEPLGSLGTEIWRFTLDKKTRLLSRVELEGYDSSKKFIKVSDMLFDYPETGPRDIYELGAPRTAKILYKRPSIEVTAIIDEYEDARKNDLSHYTAFTLYAVQNEKGYEVAEEGTIWYTDGNLQRREILSPYWEIISNQSKGTLEVIAMGSTLDSMISWWTDPCHISLRRSTLVDGKYFYLFSYDLRSCKIGQNIKENVPFEKTIHIETYFFNVSDFFRNGPREPVITITENEYAVKNGLICLQKLDDEFRFSTPFGRRYKWLCFVDPQKDYLCTRTEEYLIQDSQWEKHQPYAQDTLVKNLDKALEFTQRIVREVKEFGKTDSGKWYPKKIETQTTTQDKNGKIVNSTRFHTIYLDEERELPKDIFDVNSFKKYLVK
jgi:hypothetical protein